MADGKVVIKADFNSESAEKGVGKLKSLLGGLGETGSKVGSVFKSVLGANLVSGAVMNGISAMTSGVKTFFSTAIDEGAKLEQSFGGLDTLYSGAESRIRQYAAEASKAGISANTFAEQAVSFGASLKSALGGDEVAAADAANRAIMDMADNSAKMGTDIGVVQQTYQSLARGNFAMLDNLKLGFGGTKSEMERLLQTAEKISGKKYDISNFADITEAIGVVQKDLGLAGVAAEEASKTFSGSFSAMKASLSNVLAALTTGEMDLGPALASLATSASNFIFKNFIPMIGRLFSQLPSAIGTFIQAAVPEIKNSFKALFPQMDMGVFSGIINSFGNLGQLIKFTFMDITQSVTDFFSGFNKTGALNSLVSAFQEVTKAGLDLSEKLSGAIPWETIGNATGQVVKFIAEIISAIAKFSQKVDGNIFRGLLIGIPAAIAGFKAFNFLKSFNPFSFFKKNAADGVGGVGEAVKRSKSTISQVFTGLSNVIKSSGTAIKMAATGIGTGISTAFKGIGTGVATAARGIGAALKMLNPAQMLAFGGAVAIAAVGIGAGVAIIVAGFALLATQGQGISQIITAIGSAFSMVASTLIGAFAQAIVTVAGVLPIVAQSLAMLAPLVTAFGQAISMVIVAIGSVAPQFAILAVAIGSAVSSVIGAISGLVTAIAGGISQIITAVTPIVEIISTTFTTVVAIVANAIVQIVQALAPFIPAITDMVVQVAPHLASIAQSFSDMVAQISPIIDSLTNLVRGLGDSIRTVLDGARGVILSFGESVRNILDGIAGVFDSIGNAALNAGQGVKLMAQGIKMLVDLKLRDLVGTLAAVATGLTAIAGSGIASAGPGLQQAGIGLRLIATSAQVASVAMQALPAAFSSLSSSIGTLPSAMTTAGSAMMSFASAVMTSFAGLAGSTASISALQGRLTVLSASMMMAQAGAAAMSAGFSAVSAVIGALGGILGTVPARFTAITTSAMMARTSIMQLAISAPAVASGFARISSSATSAMAQLNSAVRSAMTQAVSTMRSSMTQMVSIVNNSANQMAKAGQKAGKGVADGVTNGIKNGTSGAQGAMQAMVNAIRSTGMSGVSVMQQVGSHIAQGLAQGMLSGLAAVTSAANALVAQAERAARAKAQIHSPARLFRDRVGKYISQGIAVGIEGNSGYVVDSLAHVQDEMMKYRFRPEELLSSGGGNIASTVKLSSSAEPVRANYVANDKEKSDTLVKRALEIAEQAINRPVQMVMDTGALVAEIGNPIQNYQDNAMQLQQLMKGEW
ncbi:TPA: tail tape measure protein [Streptococcus suis]